MFYCIEDSDTGVDSKQGEVLALGGLPERKAVDRKPAWVSSINSSNIISRALEGEQFINNGGHDRTATHYIHSTNGNKNPNKNVQIGFNELLDDEDDILIGSSGEDGVMIEYWDEEDKKWVVHSTTNDNQEEEY